ncbi:sugar phosphate isomerase/epimerase [bacterium]|nr:sugar phosphate isomerase/epimerase [bacterium]
MKLLLGATSCTFEGTILQNVCAMAPQVDDIELILYNCQGDNNFLSASEVAKLRQLSQEFNVGYTVHLPSSLGKVDMDERWLNKAVDDWRKGVECTLDLQPRAYIWHWEAERFGLSPAEDLEFWHSRVREAAERFLSYNLVSPKLLCVENLSFAYQFIYDDVRELELSVCLDIGHWRRFYPEDNLWKELLPKVKVIHLHGVDRINDCDHLAFSKDDKCYWQELAKALRELNDDRELVLTFEVFNCEHWQICQSMWKSIEREEWL